MPEKQDKAASCGRSLAKMLARLLLLALVAITAGTLINRLLHRADQATGPAGFAQGVAHGALMPVALPNLLAGDDVTIYAAVNTGRPYKLGYTLGVNGCGALFFGVLYWRFSRWRRNRDQPAEG